jgi:hypothetical protein
MRPAGFLEKVICRLRSPLATLPETRHMTSMRESLKTGYDGLSHRLIAESLIMGVHHVLGSSVEGDIAEFGTHTGRTAKVIAMAMKLYRLDRQLHLFDSFEGLPEASDPADKDNEHVKAGVWSAGAFKGASPETLKSWCGNYIGAERVKTYKGWFSDTLPTVAPGQRYSMIHIDSDFYSSAFDVLDFMFRTSALTPGSLIYFDDWDCNRASNNHGERKAWREVVDLHKVSYDDWGGYGWCAHKFLIQGYTPAKR